jgi:hypothetical protein
VIAGGDLYVIICRRAYELYVQRGNQSRSALDDRRQAEDEILRPGKDAHVDEASEESFLAEAARGGGIPATTVDKVRTLGKEQHKNVRKETYEPKRLRRTSREKAR